MLLYKSTIEIWSEFDPETVELEVLAREATEGMAICDTQTTVRVELEQAPEGVQSFFVGLAPEG